MLARCLVSVLVLFVLGLQAERTFQVLERASRRLGVGRWVSEALRDPKLFPFLTYPMYAQPHYDGESVPDYRVFGELEDGTRIPITARDLHVNHWIFVRQFAMPLRAGRVEQALAMLAPLEEVLGSRVTRLQLENHPVVVSSTGFWRSAPEVLADVAVARDVAVPGSPP